LSTSWSARVAFARDDAIGTAEKVEVIHVRRAEIDLQRRENVGDADAEHLRLGAVDIEIKLRRRRLEQREHLLHADRLVSAAHHGDHGCLQDLRAAPRTILDHHAEAAGIADARNGRRRRDEDESLVNRSQLLEQLALDGGGRLHGVVRAFIERVERHEDGASIGRIGEGRAEKPRRYGMRVPGIRRDSVPR
jgi:hypothetical protein